MALSIPAISTLWWREITRFRRQRSRVIGALAQPMLFWLLLGGGLSASFRPTGVPENLGYPEYFYPGIMVLAMLFTAIFATIAVVEDRREGFLQGVMVAPVSRLNIVLGQSLGASTLALLQAVIFLILAPMAGISLSVGSVLAVLAVLAMLAFGLTNLGLMIAWRLQSTQGFHAIMNLMLMPLWLLSGAFFPLTGVPLWLEWLMRINPITYGMAALRRCLYLSSDAAAGAVP
ncbi:MAG: ABC transporter permease, partial [Candidatus Tectomicrobia bacterium]|nr:ABC transporter permease [Candidatus Tectomicrobia bacterium]